MVVQEGNETIFRKHVFRRVAPFRWCYNFVELHQISEKGMQLDETFDFHRPYKEVPRRDLDRLHRFPPRIDLRLESES